MLTVTLLNAALLAFTGYALSLDSDAEVELHGSPTYPGD